MATQITCITPDTSDSDRRIDGVGGDGWVKGEDEVIEEIEAGADYYVEVDGEPVRVEVGKHRDRKHLKTHADGVEVNNLLALPTCPTRP